MVIQSRGHRLVEFDVWEQVSQAIHPEIHSRRERSSQGPDPPSDCIASNLNALHSLIDLVYGCGTN